MRSFNLRLMRHRICKENNMTSKKTAFTLLIAVFILGFAVGTMTSRYLFPAPNSHHSHKDRSKSTLEKFTRELNLTPEQQATLSDLLDTIKVKYDSLRRENGPRYKAVRDYFKSEFSKVLTPEQLERYLEMDREFREKMKKKSNGDRTK